MNTLDSWFSEWKIYRSLRNAVSGGCWMRVRAFTADGSAPWSQWERLTEVPEWAKGSFQ